MSNNVKYALANIAQIKRAVGHDVSLEMHLHNGLVKRRKQSVPESVTYQKTKPTDATELLTRLDRFDTRNPAKYSSKTARQVLAQAKTLHNQEALLISKQ